MDMNSTITDCQAPFLNQQEFPYRGGAVLNRYCGFLGEGLDCCLPCPLTQWAYSNDFDSRIAASNYISIASLICNVLLLLTFLVLPEDKGHRHYLSVGLTVSLIMVALAFVIPLGTKPDACYDSITPADMYTDMSCAWTGALLQAGAMGAVIWILLRSIWTMLRIIWDFKHVSYFKWFSIVLGIGLPGVFLAISLPISQVSYRFGYVCFPNSPTAFATWFGEILAFAGLSAILMLITLLYCLWVYTRNILVGGGGGGTSHSGLPTSNSAATPTTPGSAALSKPKTTSASSLTSSRRRRVAWRRVAKVLKLQWRTILLAFVIFNLTAFFASIFVDQMLAAIMALNPMHLQDEMPWVECLIRNKGDKTMCLGLSKPLGLKEDRVIGSLYMASLVGIIVFLLMLRRSMFVGWYELLSNPRHLLKRLGRRGSASSDDGFIIVSPKRVSIGKPLQSDMAQRRRTDVPSVPAVPPEYETLAVHAPIGSEKLETEAEVCEPKTETKHGKGEHETKGRMSV